MLPLEGARTTSRCFSIIFFELRWQKTINFVIEVFTTSFTWSWSGKKRSKTSTSLNLFLTPLSTSSNNANFSLKTPFKILNAALMSLLFSSKKADASSTRLRKTIYREVMTSQTREKLNSWFTSRAFWIRIEEQFVTKSKTFLESNRHNKSRYISLRWGSSVKVKDPESSSVSSPKIQQFELWQKWPRTNRNKFPWKRRLMLIYFCQIIPLKS